MNAQKFTQKSLEAIQEAQNLAIEYQNMQIEESHLIVALIRQENGLIAQLLKKMELDSEAVETAAMAEVEKLPRVTGSGRESGKVYVSAAVDSALVYAEQMAEKMKDDYVSVEHVFLCWKIRMMPLNGSLHSLELKRTNFWQCCSPCGEIQG